MRLVHRIRAKRQPADGQPSSASRQLTRRDLTKWSRRSRSVLGGLHWTRGGGSWQKDWWWRRPPPPPPAEHPQRQSASDDTTLPPADHSKPTAVAHITLGEHESSSYHAVLLHYVSQVSASHTLFLPLIVCPALMGYTCSLLTCPTFCIKSMCFQLLWSVCCVCMCPLRPLVPAWSLRFSEFWVSPCFGLLHFSTLACLQCIFVRSLSLSVPLTKSNLLIFLSRITSYPLFILFDGHGPQTK